MDGTQIDQLARFLAGMLSRRDTGRGLVALVLGSTVASSRSQASNAGKKRIRKKCGACRTKKNGKCRGKKPDGLPCRGGQCRNGRCNRGCCGDGCADGVRRG